MDISDARQKSTVLLYIPATGLVPMIKTTSKPRKAAAPKTVKRISPRSACTDEDYESGCPTAEISGKDTKTPQAMAAKACLIFPFLHKLMSSRCQPAFLPQEFAALPAQGCLHPLRLSFISLLCLLSPLLLSRHCTRTSSPMRLR